MSAPPAQLVSLLGLDPDAYRPHPLHGAERTYREINCYADIFVELLHARGEEPLAVMGATVRMWSADHAVKRTAPPTDAA